MVRWWKRFMRETICWLRMDNRSLVAGHRPHRYCEVVESAGCRRTLPRKRRERRDPYEASGLRSLNGGLLRSTAERRVAHAYYRIGSDECVVERVLNHPDVPTSSYER